jgi:hypothetical protein
MNTKMKTLPTHPFRISFDTQASLVLDSVAKKPILIGPKRDEGIGGI